MKLVLDDILGKHKGQPCVVAAHGPSLSPYVDRIQSLQENNNFLSLIIGLWLILNLQFIIV